MSEPVIRRTSAGVAIEFADGRSVVVSPQECSDLVEAAERFLQEPDLEPAPTRDVRRNGSTFKVVRSRHWRFWTALEAGHWEPNTFTIFDEFLHPECVVLDIGAWIGPTALYAAQKAKAVFAFEPDPVAFAELRRNHAVNAGADWSRRLAVIHAAVMPVVGGTRLGSHTSGGDSMSSTLFSDPGVSWSVDGIVLGQFIIDHGLQGSELFIKMDIEGGEYALLPTLAPLFGRDKVHLYLSLHPTNLAIELKKRGGASIAARVARRLDRTLRHYRVLRALAFTHLYDGSTGRALSVRRLLYRVLRHGTLPESLVATNRPWPRPRLSADGGSGH